MRDCQILRDRQRRALQNSGHEDLLWCATLRCGMGGSPTPQMDQGSGQQQHNDS
ncbi:MAG: hypothetical protein KA170_09965 [Candidatus Promineofilum sp.]|nr:hypothetical protein [Promineifilum sp.]